jgi:ubiquinone biosynthesis protein
LLIEDDCAMPFRRKANGKRLSRVLVGTDLSPTSERAVEWAAELAERFEAELLVLQVVTENPSAAADELAQFAERVVGPETRTRVATGDEPAAAIVQAAQDEKADVLVLGSAGMQGRKEFLLGNVPNRVSHNAPCTVVIVDTSRNRR